MSKKQGVLLCNLGTPDAPTPKAVRKYLAQFLADKRVVSIPRLIWWPILYGIILNTRPRKTAKAYQAIWQSAGSPLMVYSQAQRTKIQNSLNASGDYIPVELAMTYGNPSIPKALESLKNQGCERIIVLPLFPQYCSATNLPVFDQIAAHFKKSYWFPELSFVNGYHDEPLYIKALANSIKEHWQNNKRAEKLLFSYHGVPERFSKKGDPYEAQCRKTTELVVKELGLEESEYQISFQSRFGREEWLKPYTSQVLADWGKAGIKSVQIISPAFSVDCLETLEELAIENKEIFFDAVGEQSKDPTYQYIPALNDSPAQLELLLSLLQKKLQQNS